MCVTFCAIVRENESVNNPIEIIPKSHFTFAHPFVNNKMPIFASNSKEINKQMFKLTEKSKCMHSIFLFQLLNLELNSYIFTTDTSIKFTFSALFDFFFTIFIWFYTINQIMLDPISWKKLNESCHKQIWKNIFFLTVSIFTEFFSYLLAFVMFF